MVKYLFAILFLLNFYYPGEVFATDIPFLQVGGITITLGDSPHKVREAFGKPDWEETQKDVRIRYFGTVVVREVNVWWYTIDDGWGRPNSYGFYILEGEVVRIRKTGW